MTIPAETGSRPLVVVTRSTPGQIDVPGAEVRVLGDGPADREALLGGVRGAHVLLTMFHDRIDAEVLDAAGPSLRGIANHAVGYDNIDLAACRDRGISVSNTPDAVTEGTSNLAVLLTLACSRRLLPADRFARSGEWAGHGVLGMREWLGLELAGRTLLIVGAGRIGYATAVKLHAFGMRTLYVARTRHVEFELSPLGARRVELHEGLAAADVVSVHTPLTPGTRHLIGAGELAAMKDEAILVSTARGPVIDEDALAASVLAGRFWGVGLDVFEHEPRVHPALAASDRVVMTPHFGSAERRFRVLMSEMCAEVARAVLSGGVVPYRVV